MQTEKPDMEADVVIIGYGGAGATAAITAHDLGASVIILEKMRDAGGNSRVSGGNMVVPKDKQDYSKYAEYLKAATLGTTEPEIIDAYVNGLRDMPDWYQQLGDKLVECIMPPVSYNYYIPLPTFAAIPEGKGLELITMASQPTKEWPGPEGGARFWKFLSKGVESRQIKVMLSTPAKQLVKNRQGEIVGVIAESKGKEVFIGAKKAVVMTCGGFENNKALKWDNLQPKPIGFFGHTGNTGDGIKMAQEVGAAIWHMSQHVTPLGFQPPDFEAAFLLNIFAPGFIYVDKRGRRFVNETKIELHDFGRVCNYFDVENFEYPRVPCHVIFDEEVRKIGPLHVSGTGYNEIVIKYKWSVDNKAEIKKGWITKADSIAELATKLSINSQTLENTIKKYNEDCKARTDSDFGRSRESLKAIEGPPYYAIQGSPNLSSTQGGARRDKEARVLNHDGKPIPRLYAAGEFGSIWGFYYCAGTSYGEALVFGRIAGKNAASNASVDFWE